ncbi:helix-turn-helix domain-containing protein [Enterococcus faecium]|nr:helix-turn-helix domain-containing protein [Enterococcus faecium]
MFEEFIDINERQVYQFLNYCYERDEKLYIVKDIALDLNYTLAKMNSVIQQAESFCERYPEYKLSFLSENKMIKVEFSSQFLLSKVYSILLEGTIGYILLDSLYKGTYQSLENLSQKNYISLRTIQRKLRELNTILKNYHLSCSLKKGNPIEGEEYRIRYFFHLMYWQSFDENHSDILSSIKNKRQLLEKFAKHAPYTRSIDRKKWISLLRISLQRMKQGHPITYVPEEMNKFVHPLITKEEFTHYILEPFFEANFWSMNHITPTEQAYLYFMFGVMNTYLEEDLLDAPDKVQESWGWIESSIVENFEKKFKISFTTSEKNYLSVNLAMIHLYSRVFGTKKKVDAFGKSAEDRDFQHIFPVMYPIMQQFFSGVARRIPELNTYYEKNRRLIFQYCMLVRDIFIKHEQPVIFYIQSKYGKTQELWAKKRILSMTERPIKYSASADQLPDIVISDYPIDQTAYDQTNTQIFYWNGQPTKNDWARLKAEIIKIRNEKNRSILEKLDFVN